MFNSRDLNRICRNPRAAIALQMGNLGVVRQVVEEGRRNDKLEDAMRLLRSMGVKDPWLRQPLRLEAIRKTLKDSHGKHPQYRHVQRLLDDLSLR